MTLRARRARGAGVLATSLLLAACGGGGGAAAPVAAAPPAPASASALPAAAPQELLAAYAAGDLTRLPPPPSDDPGLQDEGHNLAGIVARPHFHVGVFEPDGSAPRRSLDGAGRWKERATTPAAVTSTSGYFTPSQLRAAYGLPPLPAGWTGLTPAQRAAYGAGQTIYIASAYHDPETLNRLNDAAAALGLPGCAAVVLPRVAPLAAQPASADCSFSVLGASATGDFAPVPGPGSDLGWNTEEALDVQMSHAIAPLARIVYVAGASPAVDQLAGAVRLANQLGSGVLSMSWVANDSSGLAGFDALFGAATMAYVASSGDSGYNSGYLQWPTAHPNVLSVGGTSVSVAAGVRSESAWSGSGGGISHWRPAPAYQSGYSITAPARRQVPDIAADADPYTGMLFYANATGGAGWYLSGGTSASAPLWAGLLAVANAQRALAGKPRLALDTVHAALYQSIGKLWASYGAGLLDVASGGNGGCAWCTSKAGYDEVTGLGTPRAGALLPALASY